MTGSKQKRIQKGLVIDVSSFVIGDDHATNQLTPLRNHAHYEVKVELQGTRRRGQGSIGGMRDRYTGVRLVLFYLVCFYCRFWQRLPTQVFSLPDGPLILVGNHRAGVDPLIVQAAVDRPVHFLMAREFYRKLWYLRWAFDYVGAIPVNPGGANRHALNEAIEIVKRGRVLCLFPEGEANPAIPLRHVLPGAVVIAMQTGAPLLPFRITGTWPFDHVRLWPAFVRRGRVRIEFGESIHIPSGETGKHAIRHWTRIMQEALRSMC